MGTDTIDAILDPKIARAILSEVAAGDWLDKEIPEDESELIKLAQYYAEEAATAVEIEGMKDEHLLAIINLSKASLPVLSAPADLPNSEGGPPGEITYLGGQENTLNKVAKTYPRRSSGGYSESDLSIEGLPVPKSTEEAVPYDMPTDLTDLGDKELRRLHSAFNSYLGRARWLLAIATSNLANATHLRDEAYRSSYLYNYRKSTMEGEKLTQPVLENLSKDTEEYKEWNEKVNKHNKDVTSWRALVEIYGGNVERLSREWTMRTDQYERER